VGAAVLRAAARPWENRQVVKTHDASDVATERVVDVDRTVEEIAGLDRGRQLCECDHGDDEAYAACGRRAKWRVSIDCVCPEDHPRTVEILCSRCLRTLRQTQGRDTVTARPL